MKRVLYKHKNDILLDVLVDENGIKKVIICKDSLYLELLENIIQGNYEIEFTDGIFKIDENDVFKNLEKIKDEPNFKNKFIIKE